MSGKIRADLNRGKCAKVTVSAHLLMHQLTKRGEQAGHRWTRFIIAADRRRLLYPAVRESGRPHLLLPPAIRVTPTHKLLSASDEVVLHHISE